MTHADDLRVAREALIAEIQEGDFAFGGQREAAKVARAIEALIDAKLRTLTITYVNPLTGVIGELVAKGKPG